MTASKNLLTPLRPLYLQSITATAFVILLITPLSPATSQHPTPEISTIQEIRVPGAIAYAMRGEIPASNTIVGLSLLCSHGPRPRVEITAYFGAFPSDRRPVQLALRTSTGTILRFGPVVRGGLSAGFHSPRVTDPALAKQLIRAALNPATLISNGYVSFWNRASQQDNRAARNRLSECIGRQP